MTPHDAHERILESLEALPPLKPDPSRAARVRARCHARLTRGRRRSDRTPPISSFGRRGLALGIALSLCAVYIVSLVGHALRVRSAF